MRSFVIHVLCFHIVAISILIFAVGHIRWQMSLLVYLLVALGWWPVYDLATRKRK